MSKLKKGNLVVAICFNQLLVLWNDLKAVEEKLERPESMAIKEKEKVSRFSLILADNYLSFRSRILAMDLVLSFGRIY